MDIGHFWLPRCGMRAQYHPRDSLMGKVSETSISQLHFFVSLVWTLDHSYSFEESSFFSPLDIVLNQFCGAIDSMYIPGLCVCVPSMKHMILFADPSVLVTGSQKFCFNFHKRCFEGALIPLFLRQELK